MADIFMNLLVFLLFFYEAAYFTTCTPQTQDCYSALKECHLDTKCSPKLKRYAEECKAIVNAYNILPLNSSKSPCSDSCVKAIKSLRHSVKGKALWKCDCYVDAHCIVLKTRTEKCLAIENGTYRKRTGCTLAHYRCMKDLRCKDAQMDFLEKCAKIFTRTACTNQCLCSQKRLFGLPVGRPLLDCECDGSDELYCLGLRAHADSMNCSWKKRRTRKRLKKRCKRCRQRKGDKCVKRISKKKD